MNHPHRRRARRWHSAPPPPGRSPERARYSDHTGASPTRIGVTTAALLALVITAVETPALAISGWLVVAVAITGYLVLAGPPRREVYVVGVDWLWVCTTWCGVRRTTWVDLHQLTAITLAGPPDRSRLVLHDHDRCVRPPLVALQADPEVWAWVYQGLLVSLHHHASTDTATARRILIHEAFPDWEHPDSGADDTDPPA